MNKYRALSLHKWRLMSISLFTVIFLLVYGPSFLAYASVNTSYILLNRSMATADVAAPASTLKALEQAARKNPKVDSAIWRALGHVYALQNNESEAISAWKKAQNKINIVEEMYHWASVSEQQGDAQGAWQWYERAIALASQTADTWYFAAQFLEEEGDVERATSYYHNGLNTGRFHEVGVSDIALRLGRLAFTAQAWADSDHWLNLALAASDFRLADRAWEAHYIRGESWRLRGDLATAVPDYQWVVDHHPNHYWAHIRLAQVRWLEEANPGEAEALLLRALDINPDQKWAYKILGDLYLDQQRPQAAGEMYRLALARDPDDKIIQHALQKLEQDVD
jgi:tetratricopeptide (TPR) repeat protein